MPRWEPNSRRRLVEAAVDLFTERGYEATKVNEIAEYAGLSKPTYFRYFHDKREVLFAGQDEHSQIVSEAVATAADGLSALDTAELAVQALAARFTPERRDFNRRLAEVIAGNRELDERWAYKRAALGEVLFAALVARTFSEATAGIAADLAIRAYYGAYGDWLKPEANASMSDLLTGACRSLRAALEDVATPR